MRATIASKIRRQNRKRPITSGSTNIDVIKSAFVLQYPGQFIEVCRYNEDEFRASMKTVDGWGFYATGRDPMEAVERMFERCSWQYKQYYPYNGVR